MQSSRRFSLLYRNGVPRLASVYDVLSTAVYPTIAKRMAMKFDGKYEFRWVTSGKIVRTFARADIGEKVVRDAIARQTEAIRAQLTSLVSEAETLHPSPIYHDIVRGIHTRLKQLAR